MRNAYGVDGTRSYSEAIAKSTAEFAKAFRELTAISCKVTPDAFGVTAQAAREDAQKDGVHDQGGSATRTKGS